MRTALIPTSYNPFQLYYVIQNFKNRWYNTVDKLYISFDSEHLNESFQENFEYSSHFENIKKLCYDLCDVIKIKTTGKKTFEVKLTAPYIVSDDERVLGVKITRIMIDQDVIF